MKEKLTKTKRKTRKKNKRQQVKHTNNNFK